MHNAQYVCILVISKACIIIAVSGRTPNTLQSSMFTGIRLWMLFLLLHPQLSELDSMLDIISILTAEVESRNPSPIHHATCCSIKKEFMRLTRSCLQRISRWWVGMICYPAVRINRNCVDPGKVSRNTCSFSNGSKFPGQFRFRFHQKPDRGNGPYHMKNLAHWKLASFTTNNPAFQHHNFAPKYLSSDRIMT
jgi:hypothetical protein